LECADLAHGLTGALYFKHLNNVFTIFKKIMEKYVLVGNNVYFNPGKYQSEIYYILLYIKKIKF
jgi:hypothetical protein